MRNNLEKICLVLAEELAREEARSAKLRAMLLQEMDTHRETFSDYLDCYAWARLWKRAAKRNRILSHLRAKARDDWKEGYYAAQQEIAHLRGDYAPPKG